MSTPRSPYRQLSNPENKYYTSPTNGQDDRCIIYLIPQRNGFMRYFEHYDYDYEFPDNRITITQLTTMKLFVIQIRILLLLLSKLWLLLSRPLSSWPHCRRGHRCCHSHPRSWSCGYCRCSCSGQRALSSVPAPPTIVSASTMATTLVCASLDANAIVTTKQQCHKHQPAHSGMGRENHGHLRQRLIVHPPWVHLWPVSPCGGRQSNQYKP